MVERMAWHSDKPYTLRHWGFNESANLEHHGRFSGNLPGTNSHDVPVIGISGVVGNQSVLHTTKRWVALRVINYRRRTDFWHPGHSCLEGSGIFYRAGS